MKVGWGKVGWGKVGRESTVSEALVLELLLRQVAEEVDAQFVGVSPACFDVWSVFGWFLVGFWLVFG